MRAKTIIRSLAAVILAVVVCSCGLTAQTDFMGKSRQSEAKTNLGAMFTVQVCFFGEKNIYGTNFEELGFRPEGETRYAYFVAADVIQPTIGGPYALPEGIKSEVTEESFVMVAVGNIDGDATLDVWTINDKKELQNVTSDLGYQR